MEDVARLCILPAQRIGCMHPRRLHVLVTSLLAMAQAGLRESPHGGTVYAHVRYLGKGAYAVSVKTQTQASSSSEAPQELFSGVVMNLEDDEPAWANRTEDLLGRFQGGSVGRKDTNRNGTGGAWRPDTPSQNLG
ncbi:MAG: hypothetical protein RBU21_03955 [FCB group bacterium]|nr:hypothetical protein [FCB group bacterium]